MGAPAPRLDPLIRRLATNHDGEVVATVRAIGRALKAAGHDFHDLADAVSGGLPARLEDCGQLEMAQWLATRPDHLNDWERQFVCGLIGRLRSGRPLTGKQAKALCRCYDKYDGAAR